LKVKDQEANSTGEKGEKEKKNAHIQTLPVVRQELRRPTCRMPASRVTADDGLVTASRRKDGSEVEQRSKTVESSASFSDTADEGRLRAFLVCGVVEGEHRASS
jgi:hypothetical protein